MKRKRLSLLWFSSSSNSRQMNWLSHPNTTRPLLDSTLKGYCCIWMTVSHLLQLPGGSYNPRHRPSHTNRHTHKDKRTVEGRVSRAQAKKIKKEGLMSWWQTSESCGTWAGAGTVLMLWKGARGRRVAAFLDQIKKGAMDLHIHHTMRQ